MADLLQGEVLVGLVSAAISALGAGLSYYFFRRSQEREKQAQELALASWKQQYLAEIRSWADECCDSLSTAVHLCDLDPQKTTHPDFFERRHRMGAALSSLIDRGRWFFPNEDQAADDRRKRVLFRGVRDPLLDPLVESYKCIGRLDYTDQLLNRAVRDPLVEHKKDFVDRMQIVLDPLSRNSDFERFLTLTEELRETE